MLFMMALSLSSNFNCFWRGSMFKIFFRGESLEERTKTRLYFPPFFVHCDAAPLKGYLEQQQRTGLAFSLNGTFDDFFNYYYFFLWLLSAQGQCILEKVS